MSDESPERNTGAVDAGVFVAALVLLFASIAQGWSVLAWLCLAVLVGVMVTTAARRQLRQRGDQSGGNARPWQRGK